MLGLDTEFVRTNTFYHRLGLIQVSDGRASWLVDPLAARDLSPLAEVFRSPGVKVLHSASEDIEVFYRALGVLPAPLFDTQIAGAFAGKGAFLSYQKLVAACLGVELAKEETRTDWMARPLSAGQLAYAAEDVAFLIPALRAARGASSTALGRLAWVFEDSAALLDTARFQEDDETAYLRIKGAGRLDRRQLGALQTLAAWREQEARRRDLPRNFVLKEGLLLDLATRRPKVARDFQQPAVVRSPAGGAGRRHLAPAPGAGGGAAGGGAAAAALGQALLAGRARGRGAPARAGAGAGGGARRAARDPRSPPHPGRPAPAQRRQARSPPAARAQGWRREVIGEDLLREARAAEPPMKPDRRLDAKHC